LSLGNEQKVIEEYAEALEAFKKSEKLFTLLNDSVQIIHVINNMATIYFHSGEYDTAIELYFKVIDFSQTAGNKKILSKAYGNIALVYKNIDSFDKAIEYTAKAIKLQKELGDEFNLSISYLNGGNIFRHLKKYDSALLYHNKALEISIALEDSIGIGLTYFSMANVNYSRKDWPKALNYYFKALDIFKVLNIKSYLILSYSNISIVYREMNEIDLATRYALLGLSHINGHKVKEAYKDLAETLYLLYKKKGNFKESLKYHELYSTYTDSLISTEKVREIAQLETNFEIKNRDKEISILNKTQEINKLQLLEAKYQRFILMGSGVFLLIIALIFYRLYRRKMSAEKILAIKNKELEELNSAKDKFFAIIAHDLRNPLSAFKSLSTSLSKNFSKMSDDEIQLYLDSLRKSSEQLIDLLHNLLQWALSQTDKLSSNPQQLNLKSLLINSVNLLKESADQKMIEIEAIINSDTMAYVDKHTIDLVFRNIISNAIKFTDQGGKIYIKALEKDDKIEVTIEDTGIGMSEQDTSKLFKITEDPTTIGNSLEKGTGLGLILCKEFVKHNNGDLIVKSKLGAGSVFIVELPKTKLDRAA